MDCKSLMIGDWVQYEDGNFSFPTKIRGISEVDLEIEDINCASTTSMLCHYIDPIPLTEDILKANDITREYYKYNGGASETYKYVYKGEWLSIAEGNGFYFFHQCKLYYVHELQHALRLCGLNDLADNFKIK